MTAIDPLLSDDMLEATRLTREGRLADATALLRRLLVASESAVARRGFARARRGLDQAGPPHVMLPAGSTWIPRPAP